MDTSTNLKVHPLTKLRIFQTSTILMTGLNVIFSKGYGKKLFIELFEESHL